MADHASVSPTRRRAMIGEDAIAAVTVAEFTAQQADLICRHCGETGNLTTERQPSNSLEVLCPSCHRYDPIGGAPYLAQGRPSTRKPLSRPDETLAATWARWSDRCAGCGTHSRDLAHLGIGRHRQHAPPIACSDGGEESTTLIPLCALCHEHVTATQRALSRIVKNLTEHFSVSGLDAST